jgi:hypothetical protein
LTGGDFVYYFPIGTSSGGFPGAAASLRHSTGTETLGAAEKHPTTFEQAELEKTRKDLVDARVQFEDYRWLQK